MFADDVAAWLKQNPDFFMHHSDVFAGMRVPHPEGGHAISMVERQLISLRERSSQLENRIEELIGYGQRNDVLADKIHRLTLAVLRAPDVATTVAVAEESVRADFDIPHATVRWWGDNSKQAAYPENTTIAAELKVYVAGLDRPYVGPAVAYDSRAWLPDGVREACASFAYVPLANPSVQGVLFLASEDPTRFTADMAVDVLVRLGHIVSVAIGRFGHVDREKSTERSEVSNSGNGSGEADHEREFAQD
jgi:uncharacterized protein